MAIYNWILQLLTRPNEFRTLLQFYVYHARKRDITFMKEVEATPGPAEVSQPRSKKLDGDMELTIYIFYLVLRGLDTIEDDMTIPDEIKQIILRSFHKLTVTPGWTYNGCGPNEKDRQLLVENDGVVDELNLLRQAYRDVIVDTTEKMAAGMADYIHKAATTGATSLETIAEYDLYCHYVGGLVGQGLTGIFSASGKEAPWLKYKLELASSVGILLQKTNIIRDYRRDTDEHRYYWPREIWGRKEYGFAAMEDLYAPHARDCALWAQSGMVVDALRHTIDALDSMLMVRSRNVFRAFAIPATMAVATLELCFMNPAMFDGHLKIRKAEAARIVMRATSSREVAMIFCEYARRIHAKAVPSDPNYLRISIACGKIEQWREQHYPSLVQLGTDASGGLRTTLNNDNAGAFETVMYMGGAALLIVCVVCSIIWIILWHSGETPDWSGPLVSLGRRSVGSV